MPKRTVLTGNEAAAYGAKLCRPEVVAVYPITPQSEISEIMADFAARGELKAKVFRVESEHSAMSILIGATMAGARTFTATSSNGLFYMHEMLFYAAGARLPIVMAVANRSASPPWSIWCDHADSISQRDTGWLQIYVENCQEVLDSIIQAYKIAENYDVLLPIMVCLDGFTLTHISEGVEIPDQESVDEFLPPLDFKFSLKRFLEEDLSVCLAHLCPPDASYMEYKYFQAKAAENAKKIISDVDDEFGENFGRSYGGLFEAYRMDDAEVAIITLGSMTTTARTVVDEYRKNGVKAGLIKLRTYRPFPTQELRKTLERVSVVGVVERDFSYGYAGAVYVDTAAALKRLGDIPKIVNFITGLGGREITLDNFRYIIKRLLSVAEKGIVETEVEWLGLRL
ncbi:MAG: transketolase C-terminal domain-containing protein [Nitrososphaerota archaeon]|nr:pyruvate ferredoxin oxidoreductase [Candidatus Bathyarchaeota archaeon]MDW8022848.1 transketolase C-terminal domain-containing protein [Nitrososphaerota archaeon]